MNWRAGVVAAVVVLAAAGCGKKAGPDDAAASGGGVQGIAVGEPNPSAPSPVALNTGTPVDGEVTMTAPATSVAAAVIEVVWTGPANAKDYIDIVPAGYADTHGEISYTYIRDGLGLTRVRAPTAPGDYEVRYILDLGASRLVKATSPLSVVDAAVTLTAPETAKGGETLSVVWTGPNGQGDYIDIVPAGSAQTSGEITYAYTSAGSPAAIKAPGAAGAYDIRYVVEGPGGRRVLTASRLTVSAATATLSAPSETAAGKEFAVEWSGPARSGDYVDLVRKGHSETSGEIDYFYVTGGATQNLSAPQEKGEYEVRYIMEAPGGRLVLERAAVRVK